MEFRAKFRIRIFVCLLPSPKFKKHKLWSFPKESSCKFLMNGIRAIWWKVYFISHSVGWRLISFWIDFVDVYSKFVALCGNFALNAAIETSMALEMPNNLESYWRKRGKNWRVGITTIMQLQLFKETRKKIKICHLNTSQAERFCCHDIYRVSYKIQFEEN